jgi:15-cis-phytoene desaturase
MAFLDGNQPDRVCAPMKEHVEKAGGEVRTSAPVKEFVLNEDGSIKHLLMRSGEIIEADEYVSALPVDVFKRMMPKAWQNMPYFRQTDELEGIPVINIHLWLDTKLKSVDHLCFSRSPLLSVYADMSTCCKEYADDSKSMLELVFAPCSPLAGGKVNWIAKSNEEIVDATMKELERLFPTEIGPGAPGGGAKLLKSAVVKVPRSVYAAIPGRNKYRPSQTSPVSNLTMAGDWTSQKFLGSMEGAILAGKLAAEVVADKAVYGAPTKGMKTIMPEIVRAAKDYVPKEPFGVNGNSPIAFGGGMVIDKAGKDELRAQDPVQLPDDPDEKAPASEKAEEKELTPA